MKGHYKATRDERLAKLRAMAERGMTLGEMGTALGCTRQAVHQQLVRYGIRRVQQRPQYSFEVRRPRSKAAPMTRLREARLATGLTVRQVATATSVPYMQLQLAETAKQRPYPKMRKAMAKFLRVPEEILFRDWDRSLEMFAATGSIHVELPKWKPAVMSAERYRRLFPGDEEEE